MSMTVGEDSVSCGVAISWALAALTKPRPIVSSSECRKPELMRMCLPVRRLDRCGYRLSGGGHTASAACPVFDVSCSPSSHTTEWMVPAKLNGH